MQKLFPSFTSTYFMWWFDKHKISEVKAKYSTFQNTEIYFHWQDYANWLVLKMNRKLPGNSEIQSKT